MKEISLDNGATFMDAAEAIEEVSKNGMGFETIRNMMDDELCNKINAELAPCTDEEFLSRYLELSAEDLVIG
jgi:hypothetical protein